MRTKKSKLPKASDDIDDDLVDTLMNIQRDTLLIKKPPKHKSRCPDPRNYLLTRCGNKPHPIFDIVLFPAQQTVIQRLCTIESDTERKYHRKDLEHFKNAGIIEVFSHPFENKGLFPTFGETYFEKFGNFIKGNQKIPDFQEYVIITGIYESYLLQRDLKIKVMYHTLMNVNTKDCIRKIWKNLFEDDERAGIPEACFDRFFDTPQSLDFETFKRNKFVLSVPAVNFQLGALLRLFINAKESTFLEFKTTISFCRLLNSAGEVCSFTLIKDLNADLRKCLYHVTQQANEKGMKNISNKYKTMHFYPLNGSAKKHGNASSPPSYDDSEAAKANQLGFNSLTL